VTRRAYDDPRRACSSTDNSAWMLSVVRLWNTAMKASEVPTSAWASVAAFPTSPILRTA
jgi:hypothetical protein